VGSIVAEERGPRFKDRAVKSEKCDDGSVIACGVVRLYVKKVYQDLMFRLCFCFKLCKVKLGTVERLDAMLRVSVESLTIGRPGDDCDCPGMNGQNSSSRFKPERMWSRKPLPFDRPPFIRDSPLHDLKGYS
jgi:hypothetical protein